MWQPKGNGVKKTGGNGLIAVAVDKDKSSQHALKWAADNLLNRGQTVVLIHVAQRTSVSSVSSQSQVYDASATTNPHQKQPDKQIRDLFLTFRCYCTRKDINCFDVLLEDVDIVKAITEYVSFAAIEDLVLGAPSRHGFIRKFKADVPSSVSKAAPDFCNIYVVSKGKISSKRNASRSAPFTSPLLDQLQSQNDISDTQSRYSMNLRDRTSFRPRMSFEESAKSPARGRGFDRKSFMDSSESDTDISFVSSGRPSSDHSPSMHYEFVDVGRNSRISTSSEHSLGSFRLGLRYNDRSSPYDLSSISQDSGATSCSCSSQNLDEVEAEMRRLKLELKQTMDMYSTACKEALVAKQKVALELQRWRLDEERRLEEARFAEETALSLAEKERARCKAAVEAAEAAKRIAELEAQRRLSAEINRLKGSDEVKIASSNLSTKDLRYRRYTIEDIEEATQFFTESLKIGEGGYGPVYKCYLDHTPVAVKVLRPDAAQGRSQFQREIEVLSCIRHPNMVLLLGACPEYGIIVYEYLANGSLDDRIFRRGNTPPLSWQQRFRIAAEIATGLLFLHQTKPEPLVHRDLKPGNILLDHNYVSKISDVGLARLVPAVAENVTQYHLTSTAGTFCYIDPEYQQTGMLGVKSDVYSLGILLLQLITAKQPMGLTHFVERSIENGTLGEMLDPTVTDWPFEETLGFAKLALQCSELRRKDRPDLGKVVLPELNRLRELADESMGQTFFGGSLGPSSKSNASMTMQDVLSDPQPWNSESLKSQSGSSSHLEKPSEQPEES
ncbi:protein kinase domain-containing protein [Citrus sinensis]|uniref:Protein kinase domain-containing protein n=1 Tax=Citrus sinensis TaxID=2711 RepID=A0ACB8JF94_CITSI|nr:protein kinase domain-containing protein [Citrus sinensis]